jgi:hypothetical protein
MVTVSKKTATSMLGPELESQLAQVQEVGGAGLSNQMNTLMPLATYGFYTAVIVLSVLFQGGLALYYFSKRRHLETLAEETPAWVQRVFREVAE